LQRLRKLTILNVQSDEGDEGVNDTVGIATGVPTTGLVSLESYLVKFPGEFDLRGQAELRADSGLTLLYGRNGSGKTSVLSAIASSLSGIAPETPESPICRLTMTLSDWDSEDPSYLYRPEFEGCRGFIRGLSHSVLRHESFEQDWSEREYRAEFEKWARQLADIDPRLAELPEGWLTFASHLRNGLPPEDVYEQCVRFVSKSRTRLLAVPLIEDSIFMSFVGSMEEGSERFQRTGRLIRHVLSDPVLVVSPRGSVDAPCWAISIAARNPGPDSDFGTMLKEQDQALSDYIAQHGDDAFSEIEAFELGILPTGLLRQDEINSAWGTKYFSLYTHCHLDVDELPFAVIDANSLDGIEDTLNSELSGNFLTIAGAWMAAQLVTESDSDSAEEESEDGTDGSNEADESSASPIVP